MIKIRVSPKKMKEIEEKHWIWFEKNVVQKIKELNNETLIGEEKNFCDYILSKEKEICKGKIDELAETIKEVKEKYQELFEGYFYQEIKEYVKNKINETREEINEIEGKSDKEKCLENMKKDLEDYVNIFKISKKLKSELIVDIKKVTLNKNRKINKNIKINFVDTIYNDTIEKIKEINKKLEGLEILEEYKNDSKICKENYDRIEKEIIAGEKIENFKFQSEFMEEIINIFNYKKFSETKESKIEYKNESIFWGRHSLLCDLGVEICPYCNRQYINKFKYEGINKTTGDLDHFFIKSKYPFLALSLYNFIPSCQICNSRFKIDVDFYNENCSDDDKPYNAVYPYDEGFGDKTKFTVEFYKTKEENKNYDPDVLTGNSDNFQIKIDVKESDAKKLERIENSLKTFKLREVYRENHKDYIRELIRKAIVYNESRIDELFNEYQGTLFNSREDVVSMIVSNYIDDEDLDKRVLAKLTNDISEELGLK